MPAPGGVRRRSSRRPPSARFPRRPRLRVRISGTRHERHQVVEARPSPASRPSRASPAARRARAPRRGPPSRPTGSSPAPPPATRATTGSATGASGGDSGRRPELRLRPGDGRVDRRRRHGLALERPARRRGPRRAGRRRAAPPPSGPPARPRPARAAPGAAPRRRLAERLGRPLLGRLGTVERLARLALRLADPRERLLERPLVLGQPRPGVGDDRRVEPEPLGDRERLAAAGQPDREPVRRRERLQVELDRRVPGAVGRVGVGLELGVVGRGRDERAGPDEVVEERLGQRRALGRVGAGAQLVEQDERARARRPRRSG